MVLENLVTTIGKPKLADYISNPKGSRQFQQFIKLGTKEHRNCAIDALSKQVPDLAVRNIYALLTLEKVITYGLKTDETLTTDRMLKPVMTERKVVEQLLFHRLGCKFLNKLFLHPSIKPALKKQMMSLILVPRTIELLGGSVEKQRAHYIESIKKCVDKELMGLELIHKLFKEAVSADFAASDESFYEEIIGMCADGLPHLLSSRDGTFAVIKLLGVASAKHKKNFIKELKGKFFEMAKNSVTMVSLLRLIQTTDDTVLVGKSVLNELVGTDYEKLKELVFDKTGRIPILYILDGVEFNTGRFYYAPDRQVITESSSKTSLKSSSVKADEICAKLIPSLNKVVKSHIAEIIESDLAKDVLIALLKRSDEADKSILLQSAIAHIACQMFAPSASISQPAITTINVLLKEIPSSSNLLLGSIVHSLKSSSDLMPLCNSKAAFVLNQLAKCESVGSHFISLLMNEKKSILTIPVNKDIKAIEHIQETLSSATGPAQTLAALQAKFAAAAAPAADEPVVKKQKTTPTEGNELFGEDDEDNEEDEMWGIVGDDDEYIE
jgi:hypothetical protein